MASDQTWVANEPVDSEDIDGVHWEYGRFVPADNVIMVGPPPPSRADITAPPPPAFRGWAGILKSVKE